MLKELFDFKSSIDKSIKKEDVLKNFRNTLITIEQEVIPSYDAMIKNEKSLSLLKSNGFINKLGILTGFNKKALEGTRDFFNNILKNEQKIAKLIKKDLSDFVTPTMATARDVAILKMLSDISSATIFSLDYNYFILLNGGKNETNLPKIKLSMIEQNLKPFASIIKNYSDLTKTINGLGKISKLSLHINDGKKSMLENLIMRDGSRVSLPDTNGFIGNPIYHIRIWFVDREMDKYESLKDKKRLIELKLMELRMEEEGENNPKLRKQIEYWEDELSKKEYAIKQIEEDV